MVEMNCVAASTVACPSCAARCNNVALLPAEAPESAVAPEPDANCVPAPDSDAQSTGLPEPKPTELLDPLTPLDPLGPPAPLEATAFPAPPAEPPRCKADHKEAAHGGVYVPAIAELAFITAPQKPPGNTVPRSYFGRLAPGFNLFPLNAVAIQSPTNSNSTRTASCTANRPFITE